MNVSIFRGATKRYANRYDNKRKQRQISRMIRHLRDRLYSEQAQVPLPTDWLIDQLVDNALKSTYPTDDDWQQAITQTLEQIMEDIQAQECSYLEEDGKRPLFPNDELMDQPEVAEFIDAVLVLMLTQKTN